MNQIFLLLHKNREILNSEKLRLETELKKSAEEQAKAKEKLTKEFNYNSSNQFNGIISHLKRACGGNVHVKGVVNIKASSNRWNECHQLVDYGTIGLWGSNDEPNSWVSFDFKEKKISLSSYTLKSRIDADCLHPVQWEIEGSNDESSWNSLDSRNTREQCGTGVVMNYSCNKGNHGFYRFIRMRQTGENSSGSGRHYLMLSQIELSGKLLL